MKFEEEWYCKHDSWKNGVVLSSHIQFSVKESFSNKLSSVLFVVQAIKLLKINEIVSCATSTLDEECVLSLSEKLFEVYAGPENLARKTC